MKFCPKCHGHGCVKCDNLGFVAIKDRKKPEYKEAGEQTTVAKYLKKYHPNLPFETVKHEGKKAYWEQQAHKTQNSDDSFADTRIYFPDFTLFIENKRAGTKLTLKDGTCASDHIQRQYNTLKRLFAPHRRVYFAVGVTEAITLIEQSIAGTFVPMQIFKDRKINQIIL